MGDYKSGRPLAVKFNTTGATYVLVGAARSDSISVNNEMVDVTNKTSTNAGGKLFRELLELGGVQSISLNVEAIYSDDADKKLIQDKVLANTFGTFRVEVPGDTARRGGYFQGLFQITNHEMSGGHNDAVTETYTLESAGEITYTSATI